MTNVDLSDKETVLLTRVLGFAIGDVPIADNHGNQLYPSDDTRKTASDLERKLLELNVMFPPSGMFFMFDPERDLLGKTVTAWKVSEGYTHQVKGPVTAVLGSDEEGWSVAFDATVLGPYTREELKKSSQVELEGLPLQ